MALENRQNMWVNIEYAKACWAVASLVLTEICCRAIRHPQCAVLALSVVGTKDSFINLDQDLLKVVKISGQVESTVQDKITQKWIQIFWLYFLPLKI